MSLLAATKLKATTLLTIYAAILLPMWAMFLVNNLALNEMLSNIGGIHPREFSFIGFIEIFTSWMFHGSGQVGNPNSSIYDHILGNTLALLGLLLIVGLLESKPFKLLALLIFGSGLATWVLGSSSAVHIGASGLIFSIFGYVISSVIFGRRFIYLIPIFIMGGEYFYSLKMGLIPQEGVSFAAHLGGFIAGIVIGYYFNRKAKNEGSTYYKQTFKEKFQSKVWDIKYYFKQKFN